MSTHEDMDPVLGSAMRKVSRANIANIWRRGQKGEALNEEEHAYYQTMLDHPEYVEVWERVEELEDQEILRDRVNPFLHISLHSVIDRQIANLEPPETGQALFRLTRGGLDRHEALHLIAGVLAEFMTDSLHRTKPPDLGLYRRRLRALKP